MKDDTSKILNKIDQSIFYIWESHQIVSHQP